MQSGKVKQAPDETLGLPSVLGSQRGTRDAEKCAGGLCCHSLGQHGLAGSYD